MANGVADKITFKGNSGIYLDYNATTPVDKRVLSKMIPYFSDIFGNAASKSHRFGWDAQEAVGDSRDAIASLINSKPREIIFTSGATESINLAIKGVAEGYQCKGKHIITMGIEHKAVLDSCAKLEQQGFEVSYLAVDSIGNIDLQRLKESISPQTILISIMYANNEIGNIFPVAEIAKIAQQHNVLFFSDMTQAVGKVPVDVQCDGIDLAAFSSHKLYGPKGVGALYIRDKIPKIDLISQIDGGGHERGLRSGTLNVPGIVGFGEACRLAENEMQQEGEKLVYLRNKLENQIISQLPYVHVNGNREKRLLNVSNISFEGVISKDMIAALYPIAISSATACSSNLSDLSYVLKALGNGDQSAKSAIRFSLGRFTTEQEIDKTIVRVIEVVNRLRNH